MKHLQGSSETGRLTQPDKNKKWWGSKGIWRPNKNPALIELDVLLQTPH